MLQSCEPNSYRKPGKRLQPLTTTRSLKKGYSAFSETPLRNQPSRDLHKAEGTGALERFYGGDGKCFIVGGPGVVIIGVKAG